MWCSAISSAAARQRPSIARWPRGSAAKAVELLMDGQFGNMVANHPPDLVSVPLGEVVGQTKTVPLDLGPS